MLQRKSYSSCASLMYRGRKSGRKGKIMERKKGREKLKYTVFVAVLLLFATINIVGVKKVKAAETVTTTESGEPTATYDAGADIKAYWYESTKTLVFKGTGAMDNYVSAYYQPWKAIRNEVKKAVIEEGITSIGESSLREFMNMEEVTIPNTVKKIETYSIYYCALKTITIPDSVEEIGDYALASNDYTEITVPESVKTLGKEVLKNCGSLITITLPDSITSVGDNLFVNDYSLENICYSCTNTYLDEKLSSLEKTKLIHKMTKTEANEMTCIKDGNNEYYTCSACKKVFEDGDGNTETTVEDEIQKAPGQHDYQYHICSRCGEYEGELTFLVSTGTEKRGYTDTEGEEAFSYVNSRLSYCFKGDQ